MKRYCIVVLYVILMFLLVSCASTPQKPTGELMLYPDPSKVAVYKATESDGDVTEIVFEFTPKSKELVGANVFFDFGDGTSESREYNASPIRVEHSYAYEGVYNVTVTQDDSLVAREKVTIPPKYKTDEELEYGVIQQIAEEIAQGMQYVAQNSPSVKLKGKRQIPEFAFSSFRNANFEYAEDQRDMTVIHKLMQALVEIKMTQPNLANRYEILERSPQTLVRLAHESVWTLKPEISADGEEFQPEDQLEYGLRTAHGGTEQPIVYKIELSGMNDSRSSMGMFNSLSSMLTDKESLLEIIKASNSGDGEKDSLQGVSNLVRELGEVQSKAAEQNQSESKRPLLFGRFDTADFLVVIDRLEDGYVQRSESIYYDPQYASEVIKRTADLKLNVRILDTKGAIRWIKDIRKTDSDTLIEQFAPPTQEYIKSTTQKVSQKSSGEGIDKKTLGIIGLVGAIVTAVGGIIASL